MNEESTIPRFIEDGNSVVFPKYNRRAHVNFQNTYRGMTYSQARRKMRSLWNEHGLQDDMIHYLKEKNII